MKKLFPSLFLFVPVSSGFFAGECQHAKGARRCCKYEKESKNESPFHF